ncbi:hypothetical protein [Flavobacterium taihuense]|uniref:Lipoprotein n=1 Tax=Flavobacterium taihuense TaxID=2857508 RepID=A0ABS6XTV7_9FLAO|nr:hypothetical protein [Flavobacterium taihuense]MBW4360128.1 hypothetical protein [Flavobacterium taihuense]
MKNIKFLFLAFNLFLFSCNTDDSSTKETETQNMTKMYDEIISTSMVNTNPCTNPAEWSFTTIGSKACGGSSGYIAYSLKINVTEFLKKVENYTKAEDAYNKKWGVISTCDIILPPTRVDCVNGKPTLVYSDLDN